MSIARTPVKKNHREAQPLRRFEDADDPRRKGLEQTAFLKCAADEHLGKSRAITSPVNRPDMRSGEKGQRYGCGESNQEKELGSQAEDSLPQNGLNHIGKDSQRQIPAVTISRVAACRLSPCRDELLAELFAREHVEMQMLY
jgi:hypothetical protein